MINWIVVVEEQELYLEEEFEADLYQDKNYEIYSFPEELEYEDVYKQLKEEEHIQ